VSGCGVTLGEIARLIIANLQHTCRNRLPRLPYQQRNQASADNIGSPADHGRQQESQKYGRKP
ncbi:MAG: hypothetical protein ACJ8AI_14275, partial [Rhodopila sp.]